MKRKLRFAFSVGFGVVFLLIVVLWVRSYWRMDSLYVAYATRAVLASSINGGLLIQFSESSGEARCWRRTVPLVGPGIAHSPFRFGSEFRFIPAGVQIPHWSVVMIAGLMAAIPWLPQRFSVRTLLIATTLVAVGVGMIFCGTR